MFNRTFSGLAANHLFHDRPFVYVEGGSDLTFYKLALKQMDCKVEAVCGKPECMKLVEQLRREELPFVVIMDGDYDLLEKRRSPHRRVVFLRRYAMENYLVESEVMERVCESLFSDANAASESSAVFAQLAGQARQYLFELVVADVAARRTGLDVLPPVGRLFDMGGTYSIRSTEVAKAVRNAKRQLSAESITSAKQQLAKYLVEREILHILRPPIVLQFASCVIGTVAKRIQKRAEKPSKAILRTLLVGHVWDCKRGKDHAHLKRKLRASLRDATKVLKVRQPPTH